MILKTVNLSKKYKGVYAVKEVNMHIEKGDIYGFVGENGAGKTTIIRIITGLSTPTTGTYELFDVDFKKININEKRKLVSSIVEAPSLDRSMTAKQNIKYQAYIKGINLSDQEIDDILIKVGLNPQNINKKIVKNFSLGMRQRLGIAISLIGNPEFVTLDEPMNGLDPQGFIEIRNLICELNEKYGVTFLISSHILSELDKICNKVGFISHGVLLEELTMEELKQKSRKSIDVATDNIEKLVSLLNEMNVLDYVTEGEKIRIYSEIDFNELLVKMVEAKIHVNFINSTEDSIEGYYLRLLLGGKENA